MQEDVKLQDIIDVVVAYNADADLDLIRKAYIYSAKVHGGQVRKTGEPYLIHPLAVTRILAQLKLDDASLCAGLLHDTVEDTLATIEEIHQIFGVDIANLVDGVTKLSQMRAFSRDEKLAENFRKMLVAMSRDIRVLLVKLADRLHNMRTLHAMSSEKQQSIAQETLDIYAPLANRLGISWVKIELEDLSFQYLHPREFQELSDKLGKARKEREKFIESINKNIQITLQQRHLEYLEVSGRPKHIWSIYKKMMSKGIAFEEVTDLLAFRIVVSNVGQCYEALGVVHGHWRPIPGRFKDYIAMPKPNGYQSLHTTVIGPNGERIEIQIRTPDMHEVAEEGIAAHWKYKEKGSVVASSPSTEKEFSWLRQLMDWQRELKDPNEFLDSVKFELFSEEVFIFTPRGDVIELPRGATTIDFAFAIHSNVGMRCVGAKVNGRIVSLRHVLRNGDTCEIMTGKVEKPNKDWLDFAKTSRAKTKIRALLRQQERDNALVIGKEILEREFKKYHESMNRYIKNDLSEKIEPLKDGQITTIEEMIAAVGYGNLSVQAVIDRYIPAEIRLKKSIDSVPPKKSRLSELIDRVAKRSSSGIKIQGTDNILVHYAHCCAPVKGDPIIGFVTRGRGLTVHRRDCSHTMELDPERRVAVSWDEASPISRPVYLRIITDDREGMLADLSGAFSKNKVSLSEANCRATSDGRAVNTFRCAITDVAQLQLVVKALESISGVHSVERVRRTEKPESHDG